VKIHRNLFLHFESHIRFFSPGFQTGHASLQFFYNVFIKVIMMSRVWEVLVSLLLWARDCTSFLWKNVITTLTLEREVHHDERVCYLQGTGHAGVKLRFI
jgi:hypothetical protein